MNNREKITITLDPKVITELDSRRDLIPRSRYVEKAIKQLLEASK